MKILVTIDFSDITEAVLQQTRKLAEAMDAEVVLMHIADPHPDQVAYDFDPAATYAIDPAEIRDTIAQKFHQQHQSLQQHAEQLRGQGVNCKALMIQGEVVSTVLEEADKLAADFIIAGSHGKGMISQMLLGSTSRELVVQSLVPVLLVPATE